MGRPLLILDLDETLVHATGQPDVTDYDFEVLHYIVKKRPHLDTFLNRVFDGYDVAVWTSSGSLYAEQLVPLLFEEPSRLKFVWDGRRCTLRRDPRDGSYYNIKDLKKVKRRGYDLDRVLMIDDTPRKLSRHYGNHLGLTVFEGDPDDRELLDVLPYLEWLRGQPNFRRIDKRGWRRAGLG